MQPSIADDQKIDAAAVPEKSQCESARDKKSSTDEGALETVDPSSMLSNVEKDSTSSKDKSSRQDHFNSIAQEKKEKQAEQSPSESTDSGVVSPSSCSVCSQESQNPKHHTALEEDKVECPPGESKKSGTGQDIVNKGAYPSTALSSRSDIASAPAFHATSSTFNKPPSRVVPRKPTQSKTQTKRPAARKRSNSVPMYAASDPKAFLLADVSSSKASHLRRGKWTVEEETYVARVIRDFNNGFLDAPAGTTLRTYLSDKLNCDPMRITKKFTGDSCIGKRVFHPAARCAANAAVIDKAQSELEALERRWRKRLEMQQREADKKQAASVAASAAATAAAAASAPHLHDPTSALIRLNASALPGNRVVVTRTASWLDRANAILSNRRLANEQLSKKLGQREEVKKEMQEVKRLIQEGPIIQKSSGLLRQETSDSEPPTKRKVSDDRDLKVSSSEHSSDVTHQRTNTKRMRKSLSTNTLSLASAQIRADFNLSTGEAEDAASFIGFISSVREEAASGVPPAQSRKK